MPRMCRVIGRNHLTVTGEGGKGGSPLWRLQMLMAQLPQVCTQSGPRRQ